MEPILIGIHAVKRGGKDTVAGFLRDYAADLDPPRSSLTRGFADKAKLSWVRQFFPTSTMEWAIEWVDAYKDDDKMRVVVERRHASNTFVANVQFRQCMAQFATEGARDIYGENHWVDQLLPKDPPKFRGALPRWYAEFDNADVGIIRDLRFHSEVRRIKLLGGKMIKVRRKVAEQAVIDEAKRKGQEIHASELGLPDYYFDYVINNDETLEDLKLRVNHVAKDLM